MNDIYHLLVEVEILVETLYWQNGCGTLFYPFYVFIK